MEQKLKVFIVEDSEIVRERLINLVNSIPATEISGFCEDAEVAIQEIRLKKPDLVTIDLRLKNSSGLDVLKDIKAEKLKCTVIILTNFSHMLLQKKCLEEGADYFLDKAYNFEKVAEICNNMASVKLKKKNGD